MVLCVYVLIGFGDGKETIARWRKCECDVKEIYVQYGHNHFLTAKIVRDYDSLSLQLYVAYLQTICYNKYTMRVLLP